MKCYTMLVSCRVTHPGVTQVCRASISPTGSGSLKIDRRNDKLFGESGFSSDFQFHYDRDGWNEAKLLRSDERCSSGKDRRRNPEPWHHFQGKSLIDSQMDGVSGRKRNDHCLSNWRGRAVSAFTTRQTSGRKNLSYCYSDVGDIWRLFVRKLSAKARVSQFPAAAGSCYRNLLIGNNCQAAAGSGQRILNLADSRGGWTQWLSDRDLIVRDLNSNPVKKEKIFPSHGWLVITKTATRHIITYH